MYDFAIVIMLGLALFKVVDLIEDFVPALARYHLLVTLVLALAATVGFDYSVFERWDITLRSATMGTWLTGLMIAGTTSVWRAAFHWLGSSEGEEPEVRHQNRPRSIAA